ncbi:Small-conductance mechanosensitive channel [Candidatus Methanoperedenaceae archaeon GB37]|nr:Small-conductance mechanosensitive channel [Candidatus Methanoperedenaceae archaeon GB37]
MRFDDVLIRSLKSSVVLWCLLLGIYIALNFVSLPDKILALTQKILLVLVLFTAFLFLARFLGDLIQIYEDKIKGALPGASIFKNLIKGFVLVIGFLMILHTIGISITPLITTLGIGGLAVALALQDTLANLFAGLHIVATKKVRPGDYIKIETGEEGYVTDITWRDTTIRQLPNNIVIIPNSKLASAIVTNYYFPERELAVLVQVGVSYDSDLEKVEKVTIEVAKEVMQEVSGGVPEFNPFIRYHTFDDFSINFTVILRAKEFVDQYLVKHEFVKRLKKRYDQEGIEIPFPIRTVFLKKD